MNYFLFDGFLKDNKKDFFVNHFLGEVGGKPLLLRQQ